MKKGGVAVGMLILLAAASWAGEAVVSKTGDVQQGGNIQTINVPGREVPSYCPRPVTLVPMPNWPRFVNMNPDHGMTTVALSDLNGDDTLEIILCATGDRTLHVWNIHGSELPGWPKVLPDTGNSKVAVGDLFGDGQREIVVATTNIWTSETRICVYKANGDPVSGWPQSANGRSSLRAPTLFDLDGNDSLEVIMPVSQSGLPGRVYVWKANGQAYPGWPQNTDYLAVATASVGDVDRDGIPEICAPSYQSLYLWDRNGNLKSGWPKNIGSGASYAQPALYDLDGNGQLEIGHTAYPGPGNTQLFIFRPDGTNFPGWPQGFSGGQAYMCPVAGGLLSDTLFSLFDGGHDFGPTAFYAWDHHGNSMSGWPVMEGPLECSPIVFDLEGNSMRAVLMGDNSVPGSLYAFHGDGSVVSGFPVSLTGASMVNSPAVADVDLDGITEVALLTHDGTVNLWKVQGMPYHPYLTDWGTYFHDNWNTGWFHPKPPQGLTAEPGNPGTRLTWGRNTEPDIAGYQVYRSTTSGSSYTRLNRRPIPDTTFRDSLASRDTTYYYVVSAVIKAEAEGRLSGEVQYRPVGVENSEVRAQRLEVRITALPNPFTSFAMVPEHERERFALYDVSGRRVGRFKGDRIGEGLSPGVYFLKPEGRDAKPLRIVKLR